MLCCSFDLRYNKKNNELKSVSYIYAFHSAPSIFCYVSLGNCFCDDVKSGS